MACERIYRRVFVDRKNLLRYICSYTFLDNEPEDSEVDLIPEVLNDKVVGYRVPVNGRTVTGYGGLSVYNSDPSTGVPVWPGLVVEDDITDYDNIPKESFRPWGKKMITRILCFSLPVVDLYPRYDVHWNDISHGVIYPTEELYLQPKDVEHRYQKASFPDVSNFKWEFCCSLLLISADDYATMNAGGEPPQTKHMNDPKCEEILSGLRDIIDTSELSPMWDSAVEIKLWMETHTTLSFESFRQDLPRVMYDKLFTIFEHYVFLSAWVDIADRFYLLEKMLLHQNSD